MKWISVFYLICIFLCGGFSLKASTVMIYESRADSLLDAGYYFEAAFYYERAFFVATDGELRLFLNLKRANALKQNGDFGKAKQDLLRSLPMQQYPELHSKVLYELAFCDFMLENYASSQNFLAQLFYFYPKYGEKQKSLLIAALNAIKKEEWSLGEEYVMGLLDVADLADYQQDSLIDKARLLFATDNHPKATHGEKAALWSTFIPGAGHLYAGHPTKGLLNAGFQATFLSAAGLMFYHNLYVTSFIVGLGLFQSFYFGGIKQAEYLAERNTLEAKIAYEQKLVDFVIVLSKK